MSADDLVECFHAKERKTIEALIRIYGDDTNAVLNGLHSTAARLAILTGVSPDDFAAGVKHHWDFLAHSIDDAAEHRSSQ